MASGANRGAFYAGFGDVLSRRGVEFDLMAGISAGGIASAWFAAGQHDDIVESWREASKWRMSPHPLFNGGRRLNVDALIQRITLRMMDVERARIAPVEVRLGAARVVRRRFGRVPLADLRVFSNREARDRDHFALMIRATGHVPLMNGLGSSVEIDGDEYLDGGVVARVPFEMVPDGCYDEIWVAACSPHGLRELEHNLNTWNRPERLVVVTPSTDLPVGRWTMDWERIRDTIAIGVTDMGSAVDAALESPDHVVVGRRAEILREMIGGGPRDLDP
jgi:predicted acylesterase/phospholipase RssA